MKNETKWRFFNFFGRLGICDEFHIELWKVSETLGDWTSYGFRPYRSCADAMNKCHKLLVKKASPKWILEGDIKGCFDNISHEWLFENIPMNKRILKEWLKSGYLEKRQLFPSKNGTPQGSVISPTLANMGICPFLSQN